MKKLVYIPHSIGFSDENGAIYINKHLKEFDRNLYNRILKHEKAHTMGAYNKEDLELDFKNDITQLELFKFCCTHPSGFVQYSPIVIVKDKIFYSWISLIKLIITIMVIITTIMVIK